MAVITVGIDPDAKKHGVAIYSGRELIELAMLDTVEIVTRFCIDKPEGLMFSMENTQAASFVYARNVKSRELVNRKIALSVGRNQQAQAELQRWLDFYGVIYQLHKPTGDNWADDKARFERITGWRQRSNADNRSAAFFGFLGVR